MSLPRIWERCGRTSNSYDPYSYFLLFGDFVQSSLIAPILLDLCRGLPLPPLEVTSAQISGWNKEISLCEEETRPGVVKWDVLFTPSRWHNESLAPGLRPNPKMCQLWYSSLLRWRNRQRNRLLYPRMSHKNMSRSTRRFAEEMLDIDLDDTPIFSQVNWQQVYCERGIQLPGCSEMRQKWYPSGAKPRTYYSQGGVHYRYSSYLQNVLSDLCNSNPITHYVTRLQPSRLLLKDGAHYRIYDLTSFTSNMNEQRHFVNALANWCYGTPVLKYDARCGILDEDLGEMLFEYNQHCNISPEVSYERFMTDREEPHLAVHSMASMLGIYGNLMTCTVPHGILISMTCEDEDEVNVAGDDAQVLERDDRRDEQELCISYLGSMEWSKTFRSDDEACICLKRSLIEDGNRLLPGLALIPPTLVRCAHLLEGYDDPRYSFLDQDLSKRSCISMVGKDLLRYLRSVYRAKAQLTDDEIDYALSHARQLSKLAGTYDDFGSYGRLPQCNDLVFWPYVPRVEEFRDMDPFDLLILSRYREPAKVPQLEFQEVSMSELRTFGDSARGNKTQHLGFLEKLGYVESDRVEVMKWGNEGREYVWKLYTDFETPVLYDFTVVKEIPPHLMMS